ncbi:MAG TPA: hypothetical protein VHU84_06790 [Lacipirellulaceae bacterium]|jgi:uncharacterized membrane-anchored protein|nr:hypothetical protein [Lacipirellulaceae bacterium]
MKKLPKIDALYWVMIISANTIGESGGDLISQSLGLGYGAGTVALIGLFALAVLIAVWTRVQHPSIYWIAIILSSTAGTTMSDWITRSLSLGYGGGTLAILAVMMVVFIAWRIAAPKRSIDDPLTRTTEFLYWSAILCSSTLGTAFGDFISNGTPLGFGGGTLVLIGVLTVIAAMALLTNVSREFCYWLGIIVAHPLGATMGDYATKEEGLNLGNVMATIILAAIFLTIVAYKVVTTRGVQVSPVQGTQ